jgi:hypothetical protein
LFACRTSRRSIKKLHLGEVLTSTKLTKLQRHLTSCSDCQKIYEKEVRLTRILEVQKADSREPATAEFRRWWPLVLERSQDVREQQPGLGWHRWVWASTTAILLIVAVFVFKPEEWTERVADVDAFGVRSFCQLIDVKGQPLWRSVSSDSSPEEIAACPPGAKMRFAVRAEQEAVLSVFRKIDDKWQRLEITQLKESIELQPLGLKITAPNKRGQVELAFVFCRELKRCQAIVYDEQLKEDDVWVVPRLIPIDESLEKTK